MRFTGPDPVATAITDDLLRVPVRRACCTSRERFARIPGDHLVSRPQLRTNHAITIDAQPFDVWPWLTQMGWHLGGWYTPCWVDRLFFPRNWPSLDRLDPALLRDLQVGDTIPDGAPGTAEYVVALVDAPQLLVLRSTTHLPPHWNELFGAEIDWTWTFLLTPGTDGTTRLQLRVRGRTSPWSLTALYFATAIAADRFMGPGMLHGIQRRAESDAPAQPSGRTPHQERGRGR